MKQLKELLKDGTFLIGIALILVSFGIFMLPDLYSYGKFSDSNFGIFVLNYFISILFFIIAWIREVPKFNYRIFHQKIEYGFLHLILCLISAYSLNREIPVFEKSTNWLQVALVVQGFIMVLVFMKELFPRWIQAVLWGLLGAVFMLFLYFSLFLTTLYPIGLIATPALGISLHAFVPLWFVLTILAYLFRKDNRNKQNLVSFGLGVFISIIITVGFVVRWNSTSEIISRASDHSLLNEKNDLPEWVVIAQRMPKNEISEKILKSSLVYSVAPDQVDWVFRDMPSKNFDEVKKHDPMIMISTFLMGKPNISDENKINILQSMFDSRHQAEERLWNGNDLQTSHVLTNTRIFPGLRIAYTEKIISVRNNISKQSWRKSQEAIYTFHLQEGAVVSSLSLWIKGKEEKAVLTSKHKADSAYNTVVGVEQHDPSVIRWQEGNRVTVRVFPCTPDEDRRFKIGITAPLSCNKQTLTYENIWFDGPSATKAQESCKVLFMDDVDNVTMPSGFVTEGVNLYTYHGAYDASWSLSIPSVPIVSNAFYFDGKTYKIEEYQKTYADFDPQNIYLDINRNWSDEELNVVLKLVKSKKVYVFQNKLVKVTEQNTKKLFKQLSELNFSVFPINEIKDPENSLLISKGTTTSPNISDLKDSEFGRTQQKYLVNCQKVKLFNIGTELSPYLKTLKELRVFDYDFGSISDLSNLLLNKRFVKNQEDSNHIVINDASIKICMSNDSSETNAPDHLMRLFAYNNVMHRIGTNYFNDEFEDEAIVDDAYKAYVVTPVTNLVVLETKSDYDRFGIKDNGVSLKNASMKSSGAVPEPHEWLLILLIVGVIIYLFKQKQIYSLK